MRIRKLELAMLIVTVMFIGATAGYMLARVPAAGTFDISLSNAAVMPLLKPQDSPSPPPEDTRLAEADPSGFVPPPEEPAGVTDDIEIAGEILDGGTVPEAPENGAVMPPPPVEPSAEPSKAPAYTPKPEPKGRVNVNTAGFEELQTLPGIGPVIAQRIIDEREANGAFISAEDMRRVKGIGEKTAENLKPYITVWEE